MLEFRASAFADLFTGMTVLRNEVLRPDIALRRCTKEFFEGGLGEWFSKIETECKTLDLTVTLELASTIRQDIDQYTGAYLGDRLGQLQERAVHELKTKLFLFVPSTVAKYYQDKNPFGADVDAKFPQLRKDIAEAGKCFALDRHTAAVFHLMRVLESGVGEFAKKLGVTLDVKDTWGNILQKIDAPIKSLLRTSPAEKEYREACQGLSSGLNSIKEAWRNPTMHEIAASYNEEEALDIWNLTGMFMRRLAKIL